MSATVAAALKKIAVAILTDKKLRKTFVVPCDLFEMITEMPSSFEMKEETENE